MFLLILAGTLKTGQSNPDFTFHNVSINTVNRGCAEYVEHIFTFHNVSINTQAMLGVKVDGDFFTFHNVSINTQAMLGVKVDGDFFTFHNVSINTGTVTEYNQRTYFLYIPQCFY